MQGAGPRLPKRGAPRGLSNLRMVKDEGQSQVRQPMRRLLQSGTGSAGPAAAPGAGGRCGNVAGRGKTPGIFSPKRVFLTLCGVGTGKGPVLGQARLSTSQPCLGRSCWKLGHALALALAAPCPSRRRLRVPTAPNWDPPDPHHGLRAPERSCGADLEALEASQHVAPRSPDERKTAPALPVPVTSPQAPLGAERVTDLWGEQPKKKKRGVFLKFSTSSG